MEDEITKVLIDLVKGIKSVAPEVWAIVIKQSYVYAFQYLVAFLSFTILAIVGSRYFYLVIGKKKTELEEFGMLFAGAAIVIGTTLAIGNLIRAVSYLFNPEYYAIETLLNLL